MLMTDLYAKCPVFSPRQRDPNRLNVSKHGQPTVARMMINRLRGLAVRDNIGEVGFDAYYTIMVYSDYRNTVTLYEAPAEP